MKKSSARRRLLKLLAAGSLGAAGFPAAVSRALAAGDLPNTRGIVRLDGTAAVNGRDARVGTPVEIGDRVTTGARSQAVVVYRGDAFLLRANTAIEIRGREATLSELVVAAGRVLSVFSKKPVSIKAGGATIGIRGTGGYLEVETGEVYFCLCYGEAVIEGPGMASKAVKTTHHEEPLILREDGSTMRAEPGPFRNHSDAELVLLESLVGREPPFMKDGQYPAKQYG